MKWKGFFSKLFFVLLPVAITYFVASYTSKLKYKTQFLDYYVTLESDVIGKPLDLNKEVFVLLEGDTVNKLSKISFELYNYSGKPHENIPLYIELFYPTGEKVKIITSSVFGENKLADQVKEITNLQPALNEGAYKTGYHINSLNNSSEIKHEPVFTANFFIEGDLPEYNINAIEAGISLREYDHEAIHYKWYLSEWAVVLYMVILYFPLSIIGLLLARVVSPIGADKRYNKKIKLYADKILNRKDKYTNILTSEDFSKKMAEEFFYIRNLIDWERTPQIIRFILNDKNPPSEPK